MALLFKLHRKSETDGCLRYVGRNIQFYRESIHLDRWITIVKMTTVVIQHLFSPVKNNGGQFRAALCLTKNTMPQVRI